MLCCTGKKLTITPRPSFEILRQGGTGIYSSTEILILSLDKEKNLGTIFVAVCSHRLIMETILLASIYVNP
jgi:hypothetical protein